jgi:hypothetical protein
MASHIDPARDICDNAIKITAMVLFIFISAENLLHHFSFKYHKKFFF